MTVDIKRLRELDAKATKRPWQTRTRSQACDGDPADGSAAGAFSEGWVEKGEGECIPVFHDENTVDEATIERWQADMHLLAETRNNLSDLLDAAGARDRLKDLDTACRAYLKYLRLSLNAGPRTQYATKETVLLEAIRKALATGETDDG